MSRPSLKMTVQPHVLTIAGSDSGGGAGIQADLKTIAAFGCYGSSVITGLTAQNTSGVHGVHVVPPEFVIQQAQAVFDDAPPVAIKLGMLTSSSTISSLAHYLALLPNRPTTILDPVMISTSGHTLLPDDAISAITTQLLPHVDWVTPNIPEAQRLVGSTTAIKSLDDLLALAEEVKEGLPAGVILLKGGHLALDRDEVQRAKGKYEMIWEEGDEEEEMVEILELYRDYVGVERAEKVVVDVLVERGMGLTLFVGKRLDSTSTHGTGCTLSSAIACGIATYGPRDDRMHRAVTKRSIEYVRSAIGTAFPFGQGHGPLNHSHLTLPRLIPPPTAQNPHPFTSYLIQSDLPLWRSYVRHPFVQQLGEGTLPEESFIHYIKQDYHYLRHYARAHALGAYKSSQFDEMSAFTDIAAHIARESTNHVKYCEEYGITLPQLIAEPEAAPCAAYALYVIDVGNRGDVLDLYMAVASCLVGYGEVGLWLKRRVDQGKIRLEGHPYRRWIETYCGEEFLAAIRVGIDNLERRIAADPPGEEKLKKLTKIWHDCVGLERDFWEMGLKIIK